jgi:hypothetical protein
MLNQNQAIEVAKKKLAIQLALYRKDGTHYVTELSKKDGVIRVVIEIPQDQAELWNEANGRLCIDGLRTPEQQWDIYAKRGEKA